MHIMIICRRGDPRLEAFKIVLTWQSFSQIIMAKHLSGSPSLSVEYEGNEDESTVCT